MGVSLGTVILVCAVVALYAVSVYDSWPRYWHSLPADGSLSLNLWVESGWWALYHCFLSLFVIAYTRAVTTSPGFVPQSPLWREKAGQVPLHQELRLLSILHDVDYPITDDVLLFLRSLRTVERTASLGMRFCETCDAFKPDRSHHCSTCERCVLRMDHHCHWVSNCVGFRNFKFLCLTILYGCLSCALTATRILRELYLRVVVRTVEASTCSVPLLVLLVSLAVTLSLTYILASYLPFLYNCAASGMSTLDGMSVLRNPDVRVRHRFAVARLKHHDKGRNDNLDLAFGSQPTVVKLLPWVTPTFGEEDGTFSDAFCAYRLTFLLGTLESCAPCSSIRRSLISSPLYDKHVLENILAFATGTPSHPQESNRCDYVLE